ncbi:hypothetical protein Vadar_023256 [Vaccinium darrowii]|uniref:Uncharacterized protein n=1 Tax=Vaccinium darrowii TaxID=229202 RepID=A0ACB7XSH1_9ERIC|nr:hypothetical protein Vadar_023256 [Vaccinium darrowii]
MRLQQQAATASEAAIATCDSSSAIICLRLPLVNRRLPPAISRQTSFASDRPSSISNPNFLDRAPGCINDSLLTGLQFVEGFESYFFVSRWTMHQLLSYGGKKVALPFNLSILKWVTGTREILNKAQLPSGISFYNIFGTLFDTPFDVCYGSETSAIEDLSEVCHTMVCNLVAHLCHLRSYLYAD